MQVKLLLALMVSIALSAQPASGFESGWGGYVGVRQDEKASTWAQDNYSEVLNKLLPSGEIVAGRFPQDAKWVVTVRMYEGTVSVSVITVRGGSILSQLRTLKSKYPNASLERIAASISVEQRTISQPKKSALGRLAAEFEAIKISPVLPDELGVDETGYEFWSQSLWGNRMNVVLGGPGADAKKQSHALLQWAEAVRTIVGSVPREN
jgi:hypothetical protein